jgi:hypothetical protein
MSWYIGTLEDVTAYNQKVNEAKQYKGSITSNWANPRQHPDGSKWAIVVNASIDKDEESGLTLVEELTEDWTPIEAP